MDLLTRWTCSEFPPALKVCPPTLLFQHLLNTVFQMPPPSVSARIADFHTYCFNHVVCSGPDYSMFSFPNSFSQPCSRPSSSHSLSWPLYWSGRSPGFGKQELQIIPCSCSLAKWPRTWPSPFKWPLHGPFWQKTSDFVLTHTDLLYP